MAKKKKQPKKSENEIFENPEALAEQFSKTEAFLDKNKTVVYAVAGIIVLVVAGIFGYKYYNTNQNNTAQSEMIQAVYYFEQDSLDKALNGDGNNYGFVEIIDEYGSTASANLANYYAGVSYLKKGEFEEAIDHLESFSASDLLVQARAYALVGDAYMELGDFGKAADQYEKAADHNPNKFFSPQYLMKAALANEKLANYSEAIGQYGEIIEEYFDAAEVSNAKKHKARLEGLASN